MMTFLRRHWLRVMLGVFAFILLLMTLWVASLDRQIKSRLQHGWFLPPLELYSAPWRLREGLRLTHDFLAQRLQAAKLRERQVGQPLLSGDWIWLAADQCRSQFASVSWPDAISACAVARLNNTQPDDRDTFLWRWIGVNQDNQIIALFSGWPAQPATSIEFEPELFAQYYQDQPILRTVVDVGSIPLECLQAVTAIEDAEFLEHRGVSPTGVARAMLRNLRSGRFAEGGSTITQQLIKNYFLSSEKTITRKVREQIMALLIELHYTKDEILSNYLNVIYMGQSGPFQVRGFAAAADFYFGRELSSLGLPDCALLAAIINNPGRYHPVRHAEAATQRRNLVINRMSDLGMIDADSASAAKRAPLAAKTEKTLSEPAPFFVQAALKEISSRGIDTTEGLKIYTTLDLSAQELAQTTLGSETTRIESAYSALVQLRDKGGKMLQSSLISVDLESGGVIALVGGRQYKVTQYNRITSSHRQPGSLFKPLVYLSAFENEDPNGRPYSPLTLLEDAPWVHKYQGQTWEPKNYDGRFRGPVPMFYALANSLNVPTARLAIDVGLSNTVDLAHRLGISSNLEPLPSLALGAYEITPWEVAQAYTSLARFGSFVPLHLLRRVTSSSGEVLFSAEAAGQQVVRPELAATVVGMMKQTFAIGTAKSARNLGFTRPAAGKTGSTSDSKDAWFAGFTPELLSVVWVGYDDNTPSGLTGAVGALPIWAEYMKKLTANRTDRDFSWPPTVDRQFLKGETLQKLWPSSEPPPTEPIELIFPERQAFDR